MTSSPPATDVAVFGPHSASWRFFGGWHGMLMGLWSGSMQNMHPKLGEAVWEHSDFFGERWQRLMRSLYPIIGVVFDPAGSSGLVETGHEIRDYHRDVKGTMPDGSRYHALDPDVFYWAHATFWYGAVRCAEYFGPPITEADKRAMFDESSAWYARYGVSMRPCPETYEDFLVYWDHMCRDVLQDHPAVRTVLDISELPPPPFLSRVPDALWRQMAKPIGRAFLWITTGLYDEPVRETLGLAWSDRDEKMLRFAGRWFDRTFRLLPHRLRMHPRARDGWDRATGRLAPDTPAVETPARNLPPRSEWGSSMHYCPVTAARRADLPWERAAQK